MMRRLALAAGPLALTVAVMAPAPGAMTEPAWRVTGLAAWMALWWLSAVVPLEATALIPLAVLPLLVRTPIMDVAAPYADPVIFLFLGGFFLAATLERWGLHRRFATATLRLVGTGPRRVVLAFLLISAFASMWLSNTATAVMMLPIAAAVAHDRDGLPKGFSTALYLGVAYGASIGGVATLIGTPPNALLAANAHELIGRDISFASWLPTGLLVAVPMLFGTWLFLTTLFRVPATRLPGTMAPAVDHPAAPLSGGDRFVLGVFAATALAWIARTPKLIGPVHVPGLTDLMPGISDAGIAMCAALALFAVPLPRARFRTALDWETARGIPWGVLLLFGGGLSLATAFQSSGLSAWIAGRLEGFAGLPLPLILAATATLFVLMTELTSNTATAAVGLPLMASVAGGLGVAPLPVMAAAALGSSMAFMLPVATPPNAIVFGSGAVASGDMARAGAGLNVMAIVIITVVVWITLG
ncbi:MAG TPA: SLC13 family permease [Gemmatimonadales bacterium]